MPILRRVSKPAAPTSLQFRARVMHGGEIAFGPGKAELLAAIRDRGSIAQAAKALEMSYMRAWSLVKIMNRAFREPLVIVDRGGVKGGEARLTQMGKEVSGLYAAMMKASRSATQPQWRKLRKKLKVIGPSDRPRRGSPSQKKNGFRP